MKPNEILGGICGERSLNRESKYVLFVSNEVSLWMIM